MGLITKPNDFTSGTTILSAEVDANFDTIYNSYNGSITDANISGSAAISPSKISGTAMTLGATETASGDKTFSGDNTYSGISTFSGTIAGATPLVFEGATADAHETTFAITDPTADRTVTFPDADLDLTGALVASSDAAVKAWASGTGSGGTPTLNDDFNLDGIVDDNTGLITYTFTTDFSSVNYAIVSTAGDSVNAAPISPRITAQAVGSCQILYEDDNGADKDPTFFNLIAIGDQ